MKVLQALLRTLFYVAVGAVICIAGVAFFFMSWEPDRDDYPLRGIDVSHHQGDIDWLQVAGDDVAFAYIKASEGGDFRDPQFARNWAEAGATGLARGAYHFFSLCKPGEEQARNFLSVVPLEPAMLAPVLDLELEGNCPRRPPVEEVLADISAFAGAVEQATGRQVIFYVSEDFHRQYLAEQELKRRTWVRSLWHSPAYGGAWVLWQFHQSGRVNGIAADVDLNVIAKGRALRDLM